MAQILTLEQQTTVRATVKTLAGGLGGYIPGTFLWSSDGDAVVNLLPSDDGLTCEVISNTAGIARVTCSVEIVPGSRIENFLDFEVVVPLGEILELVADPPRPKV